MVEHDEAMTQPHHETHVILDTFVVVNAPRMTFSMTVEPGKIVVAWNVRTRPSPTIRLGFRPTMLWPLKRMLPDEGRITPLTTLKQVVLPAPLGPISPMIS